MITYSELKQLFDYNSGNLIRKIRTARCTKIGDIAGTVDIDGYISVLINGKRYKAHRLIWMWHHGEFPEKNIDHINRNRADNRIENLRECSPSENAQNRKVPVSNTSGYMGVTFLHGKWVSRIMIDGVRHNLGWFDSKEEAHQAYVEAKKKLHTFHPTISR
jgi:hypothetical protein